MRVFCVQFMHVSECARVRVYMRVEKKEMDAASAACENGAVGKLQGVFKLFK